MVALRHAIAASMVLEQILELEIGELVDRLRAALQQAGEAPLVVRVQRGQFVQLVARQRPFSQLVQAPVQSGDSSLTHGRRSRSRASTRSCRPARSPVSASFAIAWRM